MNLFKKLLEYLFQRIRGTHIAFDPGIPLSALLMLSARRALWAFRGLARLAIFKRQFGLVFVGDRVEIRCHRHLTLGRGVTLDSNVFIDALSLQGVKIGNGVSLGRYTAIRCTGTFAALGVGVEIGDGTSIGPYGDLGAAGGIRIGQNTIMGNHVSFLAENHRADDIHQLIKLQGTTRQGITVGDDCWIGSNVMFLDGCSVGSGCIIGAGAVVRGHIPDRAIAVGVPARVVRTRT
jgi:acetyltransferase-like isoleucine patch superfamily enzyme